MIPIFRSLDQITTGYTVFEPDQVLTHDQLNSLADYADDQTRLTRTLAIGVGVICGLHPSLDGADAVRVTKGSGITTDGDLVYLREDTRYTFFKPYDETYPAYPPLYQGGDVNNPMLSVFELLPEDTDDPLAVPLSTFGGVSPFGLNEAIVAILMESYIKDDDICSGTDCDNLGKEAKNRIKIIVVDQDGADALLENVSTACDSFEALPRLVVDRPIVTGSITATSQLATIYRTSCVNINTSLQNAVSAIFPACSFFLESDPTSGWNTRLTALRNTFGATDVRIQYYYDFLKDIVDTYNEFRDLLYCDNTLCSPEHGLFPKHLLLGDLAVAGVDLGEYRTAFYPSPALCCKGRTLEHAKFLLKKIDTMINSFDVNTTTPAIRITPSQFEEYALEERAIPYYYPANATTQIHQRWNFALYWKRMSTSNLGYNAPLYGGPTTPLRSQIGRYFFFRIEGQIGQPVATATTTIKNMIRANNLPFTVRAIHIGSTRTGVTVKPAIRYNDLHRMHYVMRQDLVMQLDDLTQFSDSFLAKVNAEPTTASTDNEECNCAPRTFAATANTEVNDRAAQTQAKLDRSYTSYVADTSWQSAMGNTLLSAGTYKANLGAVAKTDFVTPVDTLIASPHINWLPAIDTVIKKKEDAEDDKLLFVNFIDRHPAAEHFAGVVRGGTFILVYDNAGTVVADFMLPYYWEDQFETTVDEPSLARPTIKTNYVIDNGVKVLPSRTTFVASKLDTFETAFTDDITTLVDGKIELQDARLDTQIQLQNQTISTQYQFQDQYVNLFRESINILGGAVPRADQIEDPNQVNATSAVSDDYLGMKTTENGFIADKIALLRRREATAVSQALKDKFRLEGVAGEKAIASSTVDVVNYLNDAHIDIRLSGGQGSQTVLTIQNAVPLVRDTEAQKTLRDGLTLVRDRTADADLKKVVNDMILNIGRY